MRWMLVLALAVVASLTAQALEADTFQSFMTAISEKDYDAVQRFLEENRTTAKADPEYYVVLLNYVMARGDLTRIVIGQGDPRDGDLELRHESGTTGFLGTRPDFDEPLIKDGITRTVAALRSFPARLDVRFGVAAAAERIKDWKTLGDQLVDTLEFSTELKNEWLWGPVGEMGEDPEHFMMESVQAYTGSLFYADDPVADAALIRVSKAMIAHYPKHVYGHTNMGILHLAKGETSQARLHLERAIKIAPNDPIVRHNLEKLNEASER